VAYAISVRLDDESERALRVLEPTKPKVLDTAAKLAGKVDKAASATPRSRL
jgi:hypothetical protein